MSSSLPRRRWRFYRTRSGNEPVRAFLDELDSDDRVKVVAEMKLLSYGSEQRAHHLQGDIFELRAVISNRRRVRILYAKEGKRDQVLLALYGLTKKQSKVPQTAIDTAEKRLRDWRRRVR